MDLIKKLMVFNPKSRLTVEQALRHKYVKDFICPEEEIVLNKIIYPPINDNKKLSLREYREALYRDIAVKKILKKYVKFYIFFY